MTGVADMVGGGGREGGRRKEYLEDGWIGAEGGRVSTVGERDLREGLNYW